MVEYYDKFGKEITEGSLVLSDSADGAYCGFIKTIDNIFHFCYAGGYCAYNQIYPLIEMNLSTVQLLDVSLFNNQFHNCGNIRYCDDYGIDIKEGMSIFIGDRTGGTGGPIEKKGSDLFFGECSLSELFAPERKKFYNIVVVYIPRKYLTY